MKPSNWPQLSKPPPTQESDEEKEICLFSTVAQKELIISLDRFSSFTKLIRITAWIKRFIKACRSKKVARSTSEILPLSVGELVEAEYYWISHSQHKWFSAESKGLKSEHSVTSDICLLSLHPFVDSNGVLRDGGREQHSNLTYSTMHPIILHGKDSTTRLIVQSEHLRLFHAGPTLLTSVLNRQFHIIGCRKIVRTTTHGCSTCRRHAEKPRDGTTPS